MDNEFFDNIIVPGTNNISLISIELAAGLTSIGCRAFMQCWELEEITFHSNTPPSMGTIIQSSNPLELLPPSFCNVFDFDSDFNPATTSMIINVPNCPAYRSAFLQEVDYLLEDPVYYNFDENDFDA